MKIANWILALLGAGVAVIAGCSGGSGVPGSLKLFLTDSFRDDYSQVWMAIHRVELRDASTGTFRIGFDSVDGVLIEARRLRDGSGERFRLLANGNFPSGSYDRVRVTFKDQVVLVPTGSTNGQTTTFANSVPRDSQNRPQVTYDLNPPISVPGTREIMDFDLANFALDGSGKLVPALKKGSSNGFDDPTRHEIEDYKGTISGLSPSSFTLNTNSGGPIPVVYDGSTVIWRESTGGPGTLANGQRVKVTGRFESSSSSLRALQIKIEDGSPTGLAEAQGAITELNLGARTMVLADISRVENFTPQGSTVNVVWTASTIVRRSGEVVSEAFIANFPFAEVKGTYDSGSNTITATRITLEDELGPGQGEAEATGDIGNPNTTTNTMVLQNIRNVEGFAPQGSTVNVTWVDGQTVFRRSGNIVTEGEVFNFPIAEVKGRYDVGTNTIAAERITLEDD